MKNKENKKYLILISLIFSVIFIDQLIKISIVKNIYNSSKVIINGVLNLTYIENTGGAFGFGSNNIWIFIILNIAIILFIIIYITLKKNKLNNFMLFSFGLIISGGIGNLIDRIFRGYVVDYIDLNQLINYPMFNFADICIVIGCLFIIIGLVREKNE